MSRTAPRNEDAGVVKLVVAHPSTDVMAGAINRGRLGAVTAKTLDIQGFCRVRPPGFEPGTCGLRVRRGKSAETATGR